MPPELEHWKAPSKKNSPKPLTHKHAYMEAQAARHWFLKPWEFRSLEPKEKAELLALFMVERECEHYYHEESMRLADKERDNKAKEGPYRKPYPKR